MPLHAVSEYDAGQEKQFREKIRYNLLIRNDTEAIEQASAAIKKYPHSLSLRKLYIESLSNSGAEKKLLQAWQQFAREFPDYKYDDSVLELVSKGVLHHAELSEPYASKLYRYAVAATFNDASTVESLKEALNDTNFIVREMALEASLQQGDEVLCDEILELLKRERVPSVRRKAIEVLLRIKGDDIKPLAQAILKDPMLGYRDRFSLVLSLLEGKKTVTRPEIEELANSHHAFERQIACYIFNYFHLTEDLDLLAKLVNDPIQDVRVQAVTSLGQLRVKEVAGKSIENILEQALSSDNLDLSLLSSWVLVLNQNEEQKNRFRDFLFHSNQKVRLQAASLVCYSLPYSQELATEFFQIHTDPFVRLNLSIYMLLHRIQVKEAANQIYQFMQDFESVSFKASYPYPMETVWPNHLSDDFERSMSSLPKSAQSEIVTFCLLNLLAIVDDPRAYPEISKFLDTHHSNIALASMPQFAKAGSGPLLELIRSFFTHEDLNKRIQAAAIVATLKKEEEALKVLYDAYSQVDRNLKEMILMIIGQIGSKDSIPFLMDAIYQPSQTLRVVASSSLLQCLRS